jgi:iron complex outermembrane receptor protein
MELTARFAGGLTAYASYAYQKSRDQRSSRELTNSPRSSAKLGVSAPVFGPLRASVDLLYESDRLTVQDSRTRDYLLSNLTLSIEPGRSPVRMLVQFRNLLDRQYSTPGGLEHLQSAIPQDGRNYAARLEYRF